MLSRQDEGSGQKANGLAGNGDGAEEKRVAVFNIIISTVALRHLN